MEGIENETPNLSARIQAYLLERNGEQVHFRTVAEALGVTRQNISSRIHGMASRGSIVNHGKGFISAGGVECSPIPGRHGPYSRVVLAMSQDEVYVLRQISYEFRTRDKMLELFGEEDYVHLNRIVKRLYKRVWIRFCHEKNGYQITELGLRAVQILDVHDDEQKKKRAELRAKTHFEKESERTKVPRVRRASTGRAGCSAAARVDEPLHR